MKNLLIALILITASINVSAKEEIKIDLISDEKKPSPTVVNSGEEFSYKLINTAPSGLYETTFFVESVEIPALTIGKVKSGDKVLEVQVPVVPPKACETKLIPIHKNLSDRNMSEEKAKTAINHAYNKLKELDEDDQAACVTLINKIKKLANNNSLQVSNIPKSLPSGKKLTLLTTRYKVENGKKSQPIGEPWKKIITTGSPGNWDTTFGFVFTKDDNEDYYTKDDGAGNYIVTRKEDHSGLSLTPSVFFSWMPDKGTGLTYGFTAGLGIDLTNPAIMVGGNVIFNRNLGISIGLIVNKRKRLDGRYKEGEDAGSDLGDDALTEDVYRKSPFVAITYRFNESPF